MRLRFGQIYDRARSSPERVHDGMDWLAKVIGRTQLNGRRNVTGHADIVKL